MDLDAGNETPRFQEALPRTGLANPVGELSRTADSIVEDLVRLSGLSSDTVGLVRRGWGLQQPHAPHLVRPAHVLWILLELVSPVSKAFLANRLCYLTFCSSSPSSQLGYRSWGSLPWSQHWLLIIIIVT